jgi:riboflavin kinase/FMN adenylyltransferase
MSALVVIGNFDGVHRGHAVVLASAVAEAHERGLDPVLMTFAPHPAAVLGRTPPALLTRPERKRELVARVAPGLRFFEQRFDLDFAGQSPDAFAARLVEEHGARRVVVGRNFRFGKGRAGTFETLGVLGARLGFSARSQPLEGDASGAWSSTRAREAIARGALEEAERVLGRPHMLSGTVVRGKQLGRTIGFPTCNLDGVDEALPPLGVYAVLVDRRREDGHYEALALGAMSVGTNPTTDSDDRVKVEVFLLDFSGDLYGCALRVHVVERLRGEERFDGLDALVAQMGRDVGAARALLTERRIDASTRAWA